MWVPKSDLWHNNITKCEKFLAERIIQRCDYDEAISKKHRTINGYTQLKELIRLAELSKKRIRTTKTLIEIIKEAQSKNIKQNITNDFIIDKYFQDLKNFISNYNPEDELKNDNLGKLNRLIYELKKFSNQLDKLYYQSILSELSTINFDEQVKVQREFDKISNLIDIVIPYYLYRGYSINSLNEVLRRWVEKKYKITLNRFLNFFNHKESIYEIIIHIGTNETEINEIRNIVYLRGKGDIVKAQPYNNQFSVRKNYTNRDMVIYYNVPTQDPVSFVRKEYEFLLRNLVISKDRRSLSAFTNFFKNSYWRKTNSNAGLFTKIKIDSDPISVASRKSTLLLSLINNRKIKNFDDKSQLDFIKDEQTKKAVYYYNLALGSKSIENSISLLWTSLECIIPYRIHASDIENIKYLASKVFSVGSFNRDLHYLIRRIIVANQVNNGCFNDIGIGELPDFYFKDNAPNWLDWLKNDSDKKFEKFNNISELLAYEYSELIKPIIDGNLEFILKRIDSSKDSISFQLQRIYLHRNQIVHSGDYINEYTNLWVHLEWYVGKLLYHIIKETEIEANYHCIESLFLNLESEFDYCYSYISKNKNKKIADSSKIISSLLEFDWQ